MRARHATPAVLHPPTARLRQPTAAHSPPSKVFQPASLVGAMRVPGPKPLAAAALQLAVIAAYVVMLAAAAGGPWTFATSTWFGQGETTWPNAGSGPLSNW